MTPCMGDDDDTLYGGHGKEELQEARTEGSNRVNHLKRYDVGDYDDADSDVDDDDDDANDDDDYDKVPTGYP